MSRGRSIEQRQLIVVAIAAGFESQAGPEQPDRQGFSRSGGEQKALEFFRKAARDRRWKASADYEIDMILNPDKYAY